MNNRCCLWGFKMRYSEFLNRLSIHLDLPDNEIRSFMRACRFIIRKELMCHNFFIIPSLGTFRQFPELYQREYSHYHGYAIPVGFKKNLNFLPEFSSPKVISLQKTGSTNPEFAHLIAEKTGITIELATLYINTMVEFIREELRNKGRIYISGIGLFKHSRHDDEQPEIIYKADAGLRQFVRKMVTIRYKRPEPNNKLSVVFSQKETETKRAEKQSPVKTNLSNLNEAISALSDMQSPVASAKNFPQSGHLRSFTSNEADAAPSGNGSGSSGSSYKMSKIVPINTIKSDVNKQELIENAGQLPVNLTGISRETFINEQKDLLNSEKHPYFEWLIIALFLTILAAGIYVIKPSVSPEKDFDSTPFTFSKIADTNEKATSLSKSDKKSETPASILKSDEKNDAPASSDQKSSSVSTKISKEITEYQVQNGETLWSISKKIYNNPYLWPVIYAANADQLNSPDTIEASDTIKIPKIKGNFEELSPENRLKVKQAYISVYNFYKISGNPGAADYQRVADKL